MAAQPLSLRRTLAANVVALAPSYTALIALYWTDALAGRPALIAGAGITVVTVFLVQRYLGSLARCARFVSELSDVQEPVMPRLSFAPATRGVGLRRSNARHGLASPAMPRSTISRRHRRRRSRRRAPRSADRPRSPAPGRAHQHRRAGIAGHRRRRARPVDDHAASRAAGGHRRAARDRTRRQFRRARPDRRRDRAVGCAGTRRHRPCAPAATRGGRWIAGVAGAARHDSAAARRTHARRLRRQRQPRAQDADRQAWPASSRPCVARHATTSPHASVSSASWPSKPTACAAWSTIC